MFKESDKVVCVNDSPNPWTGERFPIKRGVVYVVEGVAIATGADGSRGQGLDLVGVSLPLNKRGEPYMACATRFRLLADVQEENRRLVRRACRPDAYQEWADSPDARFFGDE